MMLESVSKLETAFALLLKKDPDVIQSADVPPIIRDRVFWASIEVLNKILVPFSKVMTAIQAKTATLADITRYWLYLARVMRDELPKVAAASDFMSHCIGAFNSRCKEMNLPECRLALFLDPRYKAAADAPGKFADLLFAAVTIMQNRHYSSTHCQNLGLDPKLTIVHLAVFLYDVVPHAATVERLFSLMGWYHNARRNRLGVDSTGSMTAIKTFYEQKPPCVNRQASSIDLDIQEGLDGANGQASAVPPAETVADLEIHMAKADELEHTLNPFYIMDKDIFMQAQDPTVSFTELLLGSEGSGFSLDHEALAESYRPVDPTAAAIEGLGPAAGAAFDVQALVANAMQP
ncbi:hypothetical protein CVIRNUC_000313 [Coccomyxa viridis]|uniref:Uncharacterized protein n=1 Tax=Coccomyxa viridis TaxID=1274662 RepID=A0AAV1HQ41_9CHLO|nr:hypothetical protein CVIRNUC_000313 [Coccomyxa viridis]